MMTKHSQTVAGSVIMDLGVWERFSSDELDRNIAALHELVDRSVRTERSAERQPAELSIIEGAMSKRDDW